MSFVVPAHICLNNTGFQSYAAARSLATFLEVDVAGYSGNEQRKQSGENCTVLPVRTLPTLRLGSL
jgi:hypothetical protein